MMKESGDKSEKPRHPTSIKLVWKQSSRSEGDAQNPRGILKSSGYTAQLQSSSGRLNEEPHSEALQIMMKNRRQSFQFRNTGDVIIQMATKPRGNITLGHLPHIPARRSDPPSKFTKDILNEAMIEPPGGQGDFHVAGSEFEEPREVLRDSQRGDFNLIPRNKEELMKQELADEKIKNMRLMMELKQAKEDESQWKEKYEEIVKKVRATIEIWVPEKGDSGG
uniref:WH2 domain-containing protein n=2 Tax=Caenorhabditis tropicalis TaxID=1561998 RepID=A0A1I7TQ09_9PELO